MVNRLSVCTIGGGSGMPIINKGLVSAGYKNINSIVTTFDSGGDSGRIRTDERGKTLAMSDYWRSLISLWKDGKQKELWEEMLRFRDGRGRNFGNAFFQFMSEKSGDLSSVDALFSKLTGANLEGQVIPVSLSPSNLCFSTGSGKTYSGEHMLDDLRMSMDRVEKIWLDPGVKANTEAAKALIESDVIIICPGSMYGSVLINFLPKGMINAYRKSKAKKILMTNIMSVASENYKYSQDDYCQVFGGYLGVKKPFDLIIMPDLSILDKKLLKKILKLYAFEHSSPIIYDKKSSLKTVVADIAVIDEHNLRLRHSEEKLGRFFAKMA